MTVVELEHEAVSVRFDGARSAAEHDRDAVRGVQSLDRPGDRFRHHAAEQARRAFDDVHGAAAHACRCGDLQADEATADDRDGGAGSQSGRESDGVVDRAQSHHAAKACAR